METRNGKKLSPMTSIDWKWWLLRLCLNAFFLNKTMLFIFKPYYRYYRDSKCYTISFHQQTKKKRSFLKTKNRTFKTTRRKNHLVRIKMAISVFYSNFVHSSSMRFTLITSKMCRFNVEPEKKMTRCACKHALNVLRADLSFSLFVSLGAHFKWIFGFFCVYFNFH